MTAMGELPTWVWDILIELEDQRDTHPELLFQAATMDEPAKYDWCSCALLDKVPPDVITKVRAIREYTQAKARDATQMRA